MRTAFIIVSLCVVALIAGIIGYFGRDSQLSNAAAIAQSTPGAMVAVPNKPTEIREEAVQPIVQSPEAPKKRSQSTLPAVESDAGSPVEPVPASTPFSRALATLISEQTSFGQKQAAWGQLRDAGQLEQAIEVLKQAAADHPTSPAYPAALGQAQLHQAGVIARAGGRISDMGMLGMQADQNFDAALRLDPSNWEAQFFKAAAMSYWPLELNKGEEVIQRLASLIDQQETAAPEPQFAQTYVVLGDQYEKMGQFDYAAATWQIGAQKFPGNATLQERNRAH